MGDEKGDYSHNKIDMIIKRLVNAVQHITSELDAVREEIKPLFLMMQHYKTNLQNQKNLPQNDELARNDSIKSEKERPKQDTWKIDKLFIHSDDKEKETAIKPKLSSKNSQKDNKYVETRQKEYKGLILTKIDTRKEYTSKADTVQRSASEKSSKNDLNKTPEKSEPEPLKISAVNKDSKTSKNLDNNPSTMTKSKIEGDVKKQDKNLNQIQIPTGGFGGFLFHKKDAPPKTSITQIKAAGSSPANQNGFSDLDVLKSPIQRSDLKTVRVYGNMLPNRENDTYKSFKLNDFDETLMILPKILDKYMIRDEPPTKYALFLCYRGEGILNINL